VMTIRYDSTPHGVMVQVHLATPTDGNGRPCSTSWSRAKTRLINWLTQKQKESRAFPADGLDDALSFFALDADERAAVRALAIELRADSDPNHARSAGTARAPKQR